jgi:hypothetical protein
VAIGAATARSARVGGRGEVEDLVAMIEDLLLLVELSEVR